MYVCVYACVYVCSSVGKIKFRLAETRNVTEFMGGGIPHEETCMIEQEMEDNIKITMNGR
jgi:hypothetical protein